MDMITWVQILDETVCILLKANTLGKGKDLTILPPAMGKKLGRLFVCMCVCIYIVCVYIYKY